MNQPIEKKGFLFLLANGGAVTLRKGPVSHSPRIFWPAGLRSGSAVVVKIIPVKK